VLQKCPAVACPHFQSTCVPMCQVLEINLMMMNNESSFICADFEDETIEDPHYDDPDENPPLTYSVVVPHQTAITTDNDYVDELDYEDSETQPPEYLTVFS